LGGLSANAAHHIGMRQGLWHSLSRLDVLGRRDGLGDSRVQGGSPAWDGQAGLSMVAGGWSVTHCASGTKTQRRSHLARLDAKTVGPLEVKMRERRWIRAQGAEVNN
jgi:hypothetical protein